MVLVVGVFGVLVFVVSSGFCGVFDFCGVLVFLVFQASWCF